LVEILEELIINIRKNSLEYTNLVNAIKELEEYQEQVQNLNKTTDLNLLFIIYEKIISASMEMRKLLSNFIDLDTYDSIGYAFYYNN
jgi:hypothetical protein